LVYVPAGEGDNGDKAFSFTKAVVAIVVSFELLLAVGAVAELVIAKLGIVSKPDCASGNVRNCDFRLFIVKSCVFPNKALSNMGRFSLGGGYADILYN
jgi:hypothetical protein